MQIQLFAEYNEVQGLSFFQRLMENVKAEDSDVVQQFMLVL